MKWKHLFDKLGKQPLRVTNHEHVHAKIDMNGTVYDIPLSLKFDTSGHPYLEGKLEKTA